MLHVFPPNLVELLASGLCKPPENKEQVEHIYPPPQRCRETSEVQLEKSWNNLLPTSNPKINQTPRKIMRISFLRRWFITESIRYFGENEFWISRVVHQQRPFLLSASTPSPTEGVREPPKGPGFQGNNHVNGASPKKEQNKANSTIPCHTAPLQWLAVLKLASFSTVFAQKVVILIWL